MFLKTKSFVAAAGLSVGVAIAAASSVSAQPRSGSREDVLDNMVRRMQMCGETGEANRRLQCYDEISRSLGSNPPVGGSRDTVTNNPADIPPGPGGGPPSYVTPSYPGPNAPPGPNAALAPPPFRDEVPDRDRAFNPRDPSDQRGGTGVDPYPPPPPPQVRRTGPGPLPAGFARLPIVTLETSQFGYNEQRYWQVSIDIANNVARRIDAEVQCTFTNAGRPVRDGYFTITNVQPGEHVTTEVLGPPTTTFVDGVTCQVVNPIR
jgi:hypothetical protein